MAFFRPANQVVKARRDGRFDVILDGRVRDVLADALRQVTDLLDEPDAPLLARLSPPAYEDDPERDAAYQLLAGEELRTARREAIATVHQIHERSEATVDDLWAWIRALNALRLVVGTALGIEDEDHEVPDVDPADPTAALWDLYHLTTAVQHEIVAALTP